MNVIKIILALLFIFPTFSSADPNWRSKVPDALQNWIPWVLKNKEQDKCVTLGGQQKLPICTWYNKLELGLESKRLRFIQTVQLQKAGHVLLSSADKLWPSDIRVNDQAQPVVSLNNLPAIYLEPGNHTISGQIEWQAVPVSIKLPEYFGTIKLSLSEQMPEPEIDSASVLWLKNRPKDSESKLEQDFVTYQIFRQIEDSIPVSIETVIRINAGGRTRDITLPDILLGSNPYEMTSVLPVRIDQERRLWIRVSAGSHELRIKSMVAAPFQSLTLSENLSTVAEQEVWSFNARPELRSVTLIGAERVDPQQVGVPDEWMNLPAFIMQPGNSLSVKDEKRADVKSQANQLSLQRTMQLHSAGDAYSITDNISGLVYSDSRINANASLKLGSVTINGSDQAITKLSDGIAGVEVRAGSVSIEVDSRINRSQASLPVTGWLTDINQPNLSLYLPAGWSLLHATGVDYVSSSWVADWDLLKIFLVLTAAILAFKLINPTTGIVTGVALLLIEHNFSLAGVLIIVLVINVLLKFVGDNFFATLLKLSRTLILLGLTVLFAGFAMERIKLAVYPQLEYFGSPYPMRGEATSSYHVDKAPPATPQSMSYDDAMLGQAENSAADGRQNSVRVLSGKVGAETGRAFNYIVDSLNLPQTGYGKVELRGRVYQLNWTGLVTENEIFKLYLISPWQNLFLALLQVILGAFIIFKLAFDSLRKLTNITKPTVTTAIFVLISSLAYSQNIYAEEQNYPSAELLKELEDFALKNEYPEKPCKNNCAKITKAIVNLAKNELFLNIEIHAVEKMALPVFSGIHNIIFHNVSSVASGSTTGLMRKNKQWLLIAEKGVQTYTLQGNTKGTTASLAFAGEPVQVIANTPEWKATGVVDGFANELKFEKIINEQNTDAAEQNGTAASKSVFLEPRVSVYRHISLGSEWTVNTTIELTAVNSSVVAINLPLLKGESVTTPGVSVKDGVIQVTLQPGSLIYSWDSILNIQDKLTFIANQASNISEVWQIELSNIWHAEYSGTPRIQDADQQNLHIAKWKPRPNEKLEVVLTRPAAVPGPTRTINYGRITYTVGNKMAEAVLELTIKSSLGQPYILALPEKSRVNGVKLDGQNVTSFSVKDNNVRVDLNPGQQNLEVSWTEPLLAENNFKPQAIDLQSPAVNLHTTINMSPDRWILWLTGPKQGPAILFWGLFPVLVIAAYAVSKSGLTPFSYVSALLLMAGLSFQPISNALIIFGFFLILGWRGKKDLCQKNRFTSNFKQFFIVGCSILAASTFLSAVRSGLLGFPFMRIEGNGSGAFNLNWYTDVSASVLPQVSVFSVSTFYYRAVMLLWSLWLAFAIIKWAVWGWKNFTRGGGWVAAKPKVAKSVDNPAST